MNNQESSPLCAIKSPLQSLMAIFSFKTLMAPLVFQYLPHSACMPHPCAPQIRGFNPYVASALICWEWWRIPPSLDLAAGPLPCLFSCVADLIYQLTDTDFIPLQDALLIVDVLSLQSPITTNLLPLNQERGVRL
uniref:Uncharacterized protein n=1 Tax=Arundo donax TaxID=35708 RepID=A0A0A9D1Y7_ARUDO